MTLRKKTKGNVLILSLVGELDMYNATEFSQQMESFLESHSPRGLLMDFRELNYVDSSGIGQLLSLLKKTNRINCLICFCYFQDQVLEVIKLTRILALFDIKSSDKSALEYLEKK